MARVELRGLRKVYPGGVVALDGIDLAVADGEFLAVVGASGSGKSTLLRVVAGLEAATAGEVHIGGRRADDWPPRRRDVAMAFQEPALYPHLSVFENLASGLRARGTSRAEVRQRVEATAALLGLSGLLGRRPGALSGGERRRVALGRAVAPRAGIVLLDEPFSGLDAPLRSAIRAELVELRRWHGGTMVLVTHDQAEALALGDRVAVLERGGLIQVGPPREVYDRPATRAVAAFIGDPPMNLLSVAVRSGADGLCIRVGGAEATLPRGAVPALADRPPGAVILGLRAEHLAAPAGAPGTLEVVGSVRRLEPRGHETLATLDLPDASRAVVRLDPRQSARVGDPVPIRLDLGRGVWFDPGSGEILG